MSTATNKDQAMQWFLENHSGSITCIGQDGHQESVSSYPQAVRFFDIHGEQS